MANTDINLVTDTERFRLRACAIIIENEAVLMASNNQDDYFYSIGGAVRIGETVEEACLREVFEETGQHFEIECLLFIHENFFTHPFDGKEAHEIGFYFLMKPCVHGDFQTEIRGDWKESVSWIPIKDYASYRAFPTFFAEKLSNLPEQLERIVTYG